MTSNANDFEMKLAKQEEYWKAKLDQLENQHRKDIDNLFTQLKVTQESSSHIKLEYEEKVSFLEKQSHDQSRLLSSQSEQLKNLSRGMLDGQKHKVNETETKTKKSQTSEKESLTEDTMDSESSQNLKKSIRKILSQSNHRSPLHAKTSSSYAKLSSAKKVEEPQKVDTREELARESNLSKYRDKKPKSHRQTKKAGNKYSSLDESGKSETSSVSESETETEDSDETSESSGSRTESTNDEAISDVEEEQAKVTISTRLMYFDIEYIFYV